MKRTSRHLRTIAFYHLAAEMEATDPRLHGLVEQVINGQTKEEDAILRRYLKLKIRLANHIEALANTKPQASRANELSN